MNLSVVREIKRSYGSVAAAHDLAKRAINRVVPFQVLTTVKVTMGTLNSSFLEPVAGFQVGFATEAELATWAKDPKNDFDPEFVRDALGKGDRCFALRDGDELAAYGWYSQKPTLIEPGLELHFSPRWVYMYKGFTAKAYRGKRLHAFGMAGALRAYSEEGARGLVSYIDSTNFASLQSCYRMGYERTGQIVITSALGRTFSYSTARDADSWMRVEVV